MDIETVRQYLTLPPRTTAAEVMRDAVLVCDPGALFILNFALDIRVNQRTRRTVTQVRAEYNKAKRARWFGVLQKHVWSQYRLFLSKTGLGFKVQNMLFLTLSRTNDVNS
jgi:hypothetical protein